MSNKTFKEDYNIKPENFIKHYYDKDKNSLREDILDLQVKVALLKNEIKQLQDELKRKSERTDI